MSTCTGHKLPHLVLTGRTAVTLRADAVLQADMVMSSSYKKDATLASHFQRMGPMNLASKKEIWVRNSVPLDYH